MSTSTPRRTPARTSSDGQQRTAADAQAEAYWTKYFGPYGKQLVGKVPHRIKAAVAREINLAPADILVVPMGAGPSSTARGHIIEGAFRALTAQGASDRIFRAELDADANVTRLSIVSASGGAA